MVNYKLLKMYMAVGGVEMVLEVESKTDGWQ